MDNDAKSSKAKFKSKWSRVFKEKEEHEQNPKHTNSFKLDDDVTAFLKPSTDAAAEKIASVRPGLPAPKLDIAIAQRWPDAHEVRKASASTAGGVNGTQSALWTPNGFTKPKRRKGLSVGFVRTAPDIIGEGGDEAEEPASEIGRRKAMLARSVSDRRAVDSGASGRPVAGREESAQDEKDFAPGPGHLKRTHTSHDEVGVPLQTKISPPAVDQVPARFTLSRTPTGFGSLEDDETHGGTQENQERTHTSLDAPPKIDTAFAWEQRSGGPLSSASSTYSPSPRDPVAMAVRKRELRSSEGMSLRRVSALMSDEDEEQKRQSLGFGVQMSDQHYEALSQPNAPDLLPEPRSATAPRSAKSPLGPSPFDDPKYVRQPTQEAVSSVRRPAPPPPPSLPTRESKQAYQPSYMRAAQDQAQVREPQVQDRTVNRQSALTSTTTQAPTYPNQLQQAANSQPRRYLDTVQSTRAPAAVSGTINPPVLPLRNREPSPMYDRKFGPGQSAQTGDALYSRPNGSGSSLNRSNPPSIQSPSPKQSHSRDGSRDAQSPYSEPSTRISQPSPTRFGRYSSSPQGGSPRSSIVGRSPLSPQGTVPAEYFGGPKGQAGQQTLRPPGANLGIDDPSSRPVSASSNRSFSRPLAPPRRPSQSQQFPPASAQVQDSQRQAPVPTLASSRQYSQEVPQPTSAQPQVLAANNAGYGNPSAYDHARSLSGTNMGQARPTVSPQATSEGNPATDAAYEDFSSRVAHMKGVFKLTAEKERPSALCAPSSWLRTALWWYTKGKTGLEMLLQQHRRSSGDAPPRELLMQPHVDLAKTWWILSDPLGVSAEQELDGIRGTVGIDGANEVVDMALRQDVATLRSHIKALSLSMSRNQLMPPPQSLIQGQDTTIWLEYAKFSPDAAMMLSGVAVGSSTPRAPKQTLPPLEAIPLGDTHGTHCYGRFPVEVCMSTEDAGSDRVVLRCILTMLRGKQDFLTTIVIASQNELVNVKVAPQQGPQKCLTWHDVSWKASSFGMIVRLSQNHDLMVRMSEKDFRSLWNLVEYARKVEHCFRPNQNEQFAHDTRLAELQYADSSNANAFPPDKIKNAIVVVFEQTEMSYQGGVERKLHRGYRLLLATDPKHKSLACVSHEVCRKGPLLYEFITDSAAHGMAAMVVRIREERRQCRGLLVFQDTASRQAFFDSLNGLAVGPREAIISKMSLSAMNIEPATQVEGFSQLPHPALQVLQWSKLGVTSSQREEHDANHQMSDPFPSNGLRIIARHTAGCITDRLNLAKGELLIRLPCTATPAIQILREPQEDMTMSIDTRNSPPHVSDGVTELLNTVRSGSTIRTFTFPTFDDLHSFQTALTGQTVRYDGTAALLTIARRMMVVPIYKKWEATRVRLQLVARSTVVQVLAFMEGFSHADALCFQVKSTDNFETIKGDGKGKKWAVRLVDAKFTLPNQETKEKSEADISVEEKVRRRFVNLEGLEYMSEHDDITIGFDTAEERDRFAEVLPAATIGRGFTLKRRT